jgi:hypothetical protein
MFVIRLVGSIFSFVGVLLIVIAVYFYNDSKEFIENGTQTKGKIVGFETSSSSSSQYPVVEFLDSKRNIQRVKSSGTSSSYFRGQELSIYYKENNDLEIRIDDFFGLWGVTTILSCMATVFLFLGLCGIFIGFKSYFSERKARKYTTVIKAKISSVVYNTSISANGRCPYYIEAKWLDESTNILYIFKSNNLWFDPSDFLENRAYIDVKVNATNYKKYWVDTSFLPKIK